MGRTVNGRDRFHFLPVSDDEANIRVRVKLGIQRCLSRNRNAVEANGVAASKTAEWSLPGIIHNSAFGIER